MKCTNCDNNKPIVNKRYNLCDDCNFMRLHDGKSKAEVYSERSRQNKIAKQFKESDGVMTQDEFDRLGNGDFIKGFENKKRKPLRQQTAKQAGQQVKLNRLKQKIELEAIQNNEYFCWGCGNAKGGLDKSHILSVGQRKDLELIKANINLFCRKCHNDWESGDLIKMLNLNSFEKDLQFIKENDTKVYNKLLDAIIYFITYSDTIEVEQELIDKGRRILSENDFIIIE